MKKWFKIKRYPHIGSQISREDYSRIKKYVSNSENVEKHSFKPFIKRVQTKRKFRKQYEDGILISKKRKKDLKPREICFASHLDSQIYSYYSELLSKKYNKLITKHNIAKVVTAYRKIKKDKSKSGKCNIDFANEVFSLIKKRSETKKNQVVIAFDIKGFFDNLNHKKLKDSWAYVINEPLPKDHYQVFKNITKFSFIKEDELFNLFKDRIVVERYVDSYKKDKILKKKKVDKIKYLKEKRAVSYTVDSKDLRLIRNKGLINANKLDKKGNKRTVGIPQGSPISSVLANIYMFEFDKKMNELLSNSGGIYRRYSDDMIVVCDLKQIQLVVDEFESNIKKLCDLEIQPHKTQIFHFVKQKNRLFCYQEFKTHCTINRNLEYLGLQFDGEIVLLKNSSISSYYRKMKKSINRSKYYAKHTRNKVNRGKIFKSRLFEKFTVIGSHRKRKRIRDKKDKSKFKVLKFYNYGNYLTYVNKSINQVENNSIKKQLKNHWKIFNSELKK